MNEYERWVLKDFEEEKKKLLMVEEQKAAMKKAEEDTLKVMIALSSIPNITISK